MELFLSISSILRNVLSTATWMDIEIIIPSEVSQTEQDKYHMMSLICGILKNDTNERIYRTKTDSET